MVSGAAATGRELLAEAERLFAAAGVERPHVDAEWLLAGILNLGRGDLYRVHGESVSDDAVAAYRAMVRRRAAGEPLQQILGWEGFRGLKIRLTRDVLVPRPETEMLVETALAALPSPRAGVRPLVIDVGTGSGCIACAIASERLDVELLALDCSAAAIAVARENVAAIGVAYADSLGIACANVDARSAAHAAADASGPSRRLRFVIADLLAAVRPACAALIVANPPYLTDEMLARAPVEVREHEPWLALAGGVDGLAVIRRLVSDAPRVLKSGGALVLETAGDAQAAVVADLLRANGFENVAVRHDLNGIPRFVSGRVRD